MYGPKVIARVKEHGYKVERLHTDSKSAKVKLSNEKDPKGHTEEYTIEMAKHAWLTGKGTRITYPHLMLRYKAIGLAVKFYCPEVLNGVQLKEEVEYEIVDSKSAINDREVSDDELLEGFQDPTSVVEAEVVAEEVEDTTEEVADESEPQEEDTTPPVEVVEEATENPVNEEKTEPKTEVTSSTEKPSKWNPGDKVEHALLGPGIIKECRLWKCLVYFESDNEGEPPSKIDEDDLTAL